MIAMDLSVSYERKEYIDFTVSYLDSGISMAVMGESGKNNIFFFMGPFDGMVWLGIICTIFIVAVTQVIITE